MAADEGGGGDGAVGAEGATDGAGAAASRKSAVLWGVVGAMTFAVLYQGYVLLEASFDAAVLAGGALAVGAVTAVLAYEVERRLAKESL